MFRRQGGRTASVWHAWPYQTRPRWAGLAGRCLPLAGLLLGCGWVRGTEALQCYTTPDFPCEVDKGYAGGCIQDVGIIIDCTEANAKCKTIMRNGQPAYYFVNKSCDPGCKEDVRAHAVGMQALPCARVLLCRVAASVRASACLPRQRARFSLDLPAPRGWRANGSTDGTRLARLPPMLANGTCPQTVLCGQGQKFERRACARDGGMLLHGQMYVFPLHSLPLFPASSLPVCVW